MILLCIILFLILYFVLFNKKFIGGLNNYMEEKRYEIDMETNNNNNNEDNNIDDYSFDITYKSKNLGNKYGNYNISKISNLYIR